MRGRDALDTSDRRSQAIALGSTLRALHRGGRQSIMKIETEARRAGQPIQTHPLSAAPVEPGRAVAIRTIERQGASMNRSCLTQRGVVLLLAVSTSCPALYAGFRAEQHMIVQTEARGPTSIHAADLDGDGDLDVLSASAEDDKIAWYANDGTGQFDSQQVITTAAVGAQCVYAADLDGDGDLDVLSASYEDGKIAWYENE